MFPETYGPRAVVTGAARGIGAAFARTLAARGLDLLLVDRLEAPLGALTDELSMAHRVDVETRALDLADADAVDALAAELRPREDVGLLVSNAAHVVTGRVVERSLEECMRELDVNCRAPLVITHAVASSLVARGRGGLVLLSSMSGLGGTAVVAHYAATKAYTQILAEGLFAELRDAGVDALACVPGPVATPGLADSSPDLTGAFTLRPVTPELVAEQALAALGRRPFVVPGRAPSVLATLLARALPRRLAIRLVSRSTERMYPRA